MNNIRKGKRLNFSSMQMKWFSLFVCTGLLSAGATPYQPMSTLGGYREIQLASNTYRVMFFGNGYTNYLPPLISFYGPNIVYNGRQLSHQAMAQLLQSASTQWPQRTLHLISDPTVVGASQDQVGLVVTYQVAFVGKNEQRHFEGKMAVQLTVEIQGDQLAITSISPKILEQNGPT
jgi:hypothetical protein